MCALIKILKQCTTLFVKKYVYINKKKNNYTVWKVISYNWRCQNVPFSITDMFVLDNKKNVSLFDNKIVCD